MNKNDQFARLKALLLKINEKQGFQEIPPHPQTNQLLKRGILDLSSFCSGMCDFNSVNYLTDGAQVRLYLQ